MAVMRFQSWLAYGRAPLGSEYPAASPEGKRHPGDPSPSTSQGFLHLFVSNAGRREWKGVT